MIDTFLVRTIWFGAAAWAVGGSLWLAWRAYQRRCCDTSAFHGQLYICDHGSAWVSVDPVKVDLGERRFVVVGNWLRIPRAFAMAALSADLDAELALLVEAAEEG